jgi:hypothetical protein
MTTGEMKWFPGEDKRMAKCVRKGRVPHLRIVPLHHPMHRPLEHAGSFVSCGARQESRSLHTTLTASGGLFNPPMLVVDAGDTLFGPGLTDTFYGAVIYDAKSERPVAYFTHPAVVVTCSYYRITWDANGLFSFPNKKEKDKS